jgi:hypothetical protein
VVRVWVTDKTGIWAGTPVGPKVVGSLGQAGTVAGKEGTTGVRCTSGETRRGGGFDKDTCSAGFCSAGDGHSNFFNLDGDETLTHLSSLTLSSVVGSGFLSK